MTLVYSTSLTSQIPNQYLCPISLEIMSDPVICQDGYTYDRVSILALKTPLSPMTRQPINLKVLIPNIALRQIIEQYAQTNEIKLKKITPIPNITSNTNNNRLERLQREGMLDRFEREQREQENLRQNAIIREREEQRRRQQEEIERKKKQEQEDRELERIVKMFNAKDLPSLNSGWIYLGYWHPYETLKFKFNLNVIKNIKNKNVNELYEIYTKLCEDIIWIQKYVYGIKDSKPFVDYVYEYKEKKCIDNEINSIEFKINQEKISHQRCGCYHPCSYCNRIKIWTLQLEQLKKLKIIFEKLTKHKEYYYVNYEEFLDLFETPNQYGLREFMRRRGIPHPINLDTIDDCQANGITSYYGNIYYYNLFHIFDREKLNKLNFLNDVCINLEIGEKVMSKKNNYYNGTGDLIKDHIKYITTKSCPNYIVRQDFVASSYFNELDKIAKVIVELIEFVRPEIILMSQENLNL